MWIRLGERVRQNKKLLQTSLTGEKGEGKIVVYFDQRTGALHAIPWLKIFFLAFKHLLPSKTEKRKHKNYHNLFYYYTQNTSFIHKNKKKSNFPSELTSIWVSTSIQE